MEELGRYQSRLAQHALAAHAAQAEARTIALHAAALLIDVRGYTDVVHDAAVSGLERIEDLGTSLNAFFSGLIEAVAREGGDVIGFAGDSMLALFPAAHPEQLPHAARRAAAAALAVRGAQVVTSSPEAQVRTYAQSRISLACGPAWSIAFGRAGRTQHVLAAGVVLARVAACDRVGTPGMVAVHPSICEALAGAGLLAPIGGVDPNLAQELRSLTQGSDASEPLSAPDLDDLLLLGSLPAAITDVIAYGQARWLTEMRFVCPVFVRIYASRDGESVEPIALIAAVLAAEDALVAHGGELRQVRADGGAVVMVCMFGTPGHTHEDDALRASLAACAMRAALSGTGLAIAIGVSSGKGLCGLYGNDRRAEFMVLGDAMNLAARLMQRGHGAVADQGTARLAGRRLRWLDGGRFHPKGFPEAVDIAWLEGSRMTRAESDADFPAVGGAVPGIKLFGRAAERARIDGCLRSHRQGRLAAEERALLIEGEAGMGKTALARYAAERASQLLMPTIRVAGNRIESLTPYYVWRSVLGELVSGAAGSDPASAETTIADALADSGELGDFAPLLNAILPLAFDQSEKTLQMDATARADMTARLLAHCVQALVRGPTVLVFDDAHWIDSASWSVIARLPQSLDRVFVILTMRTVNPGASATTTDLLEQFRMRHSLAGLSHAETAGVIAARLGARDTAPEVAAFIGKRCAGNPFFAEELALAMRERGDLGLDAGICTSKTQLDDFALLGLPETVRATIVERLDRLSANQKRILKIASVIGAAASIPLLGHLLGGDPGEGSLLAELAGIESRQLADVSEHTGEVAIYFRHAIIQEVAYQLLTPSQRRSLHRQVAEWHEHAHTEHIEQWLPLLAHHFGASDQPLRAFPYLVRAGEAALRAYANSEAVHFLSASLAMRLPEREDRVKRARRRGMVAEAHLKLSELSACREQLGRALRLVGAPIPTRRLELAARIGVAIFAESLPRAAMRGRARGRLAVMALVRAQLHQLLAEAAYFQHDTLTLLNATFAGLREARRFGLSVELAKSLATSAVVTGLMRLHAVSRRHLEEAQQTAAAFGHAPTIAYVDQLAGVCASSAGDWPMAHLKVSQAAEGYQRIGDAFRCRSTQMLLAYNALHQGDFDSIEGYLAAADEHAVFPSGPLQLRIWFRTAQLARAIALASRGLGAPPGTDLIDEVRMLAQPADASQAPLCRGFVADALRLRGDFGGAGEQAQLGLAVLRQHHPTTFFSLLGIVSIGESFAALAVHDRVRRDDVIDDALRAHRVLERFSVSVPIARPSALLLGARIRGLRDDRRGAGQRLEAAIESAERLGMAGVKSAALRAKAELQGVGQSGKEDLAWS